MQDRTAMQVAVLASLTTITLAVYFGLSQRKKQVAPKSPKTRAASNHEHTTQETTSFTKEETTTSVKVETTAPTIGPAAEIPKDEPKAPSPPKQNPGQLDATAATEMYKAGDYDEAVELYSSAIRQCESARPVDHRNLKVMFSNRAAAYEKLEDYESVISDCTMALSIDKRHPKSYTRRARAKFQIRDLQGALVDFVTLLMLYEGKQDQLDNDLASEITKLHQQVTSKQIEDAQSKRGEEEHSLPDTFFITSYFSSFHRSDDESDVVADQRASQYTSQLHYSDLTNAERGKLLICRSLAKKKEKKYEEAAADAKDAVGLLQPTDEGFYTAQMEYGTYSHLRGSFDEAKKCFESALEVKPASLFAKIRLGGLCFDQKDMKTALSWFDKALENKDTCSTAYFHRGQLHSIDTDSNGSPTQNSLEMAMEDLEKSIEISSDFAMAFVQLGVTQARKGNFEQAVTHLRKASRIAPDVPEIYNYLGETYMQQMQSSPNSGVTLEDVENMFKKAIKMDATYPMAYINMGNLLVQQGEENAQRAMNMFEQAVEKCPRSKFAHCHLAQVYMAMQDYSNAIDQIDQAIPYAFTPDELQELFAIRVTAEAHMEARGRLA